MQESGRVGEVKTEERNGITYKVQYDTQGREVYRYVSGRSPEAYKRRDVRVVGNKVVTESSGEFVERTQEGKTEAGENIRVVTTESTTGEELNKTFYRNEKAFIPESGKVDVYLAKETLRNPKTGELKVIMERNLVMQEGKPVKEYTETTTTTRPATKADVVGWTKGIPLVGGLVAAAAKEPAVKVPTKLELESFTLPSTGEKGGYSPAYFQESILDPNRKVTTPEALKPSETQKEFGRGVKDFVSDPGKVMFSLGAGAATQLPLVGGAVTTGLGLLAVPLLGVPVGKALGDTIGGIIAPPQIYEHKGKYYRREGGAMQEVSNLGAPLYEGAKFVSGGLKGYEPALTPMVAGVDVLAQPLKDNPAYAAGYITAGIGTSMIGAGAARIGIKGIKTTYEVIQAAKQEVRLGERLIHGKPVPTEYKQDLAVGETDKYYFTAEQTTRTGMYGTQTKDVQFFDNVRQYGKYTRELSVIPKEQVIGMVKATPESGGGLDITGVVVSKPSSGVYTYRESYNLLSQPKYSLGSLQLGRAYGSTQTTTIAYTPSAAVDTGAAPPTSFNMLKTVMANMPNTGLVSGAGGIARPAAPTGEGGTLFKEGGGGSGNIYTPRGGGTLAETRAPLKIETTTQIGLKSVQETTTTIKPIGTTLAIAPIQQEPQKVKQISKTSEIQLLQPIAQTQTQTRRQPITPVTVPGIRETQSRIYKQERKTILGVAPLTIMKAAALALPQAPKILAAIGGGGRETPKQPPFLPSAPPTGSGFSIPGYGKKKGKGSKFGYTRTLFGSKLKSIPHGYESPGFELRPAVIHGGKNKFKVIKF